MPYYRKRGGYRKSYRRKRPYGVGPRLMRIRKLAGQKPITWAESISRNAGAVGRLAGTVSQLAGLINSELKYNDTYVSGTGISNSGSYSQALTQIAQGDTDVQRSGNSVLSHSLHGRLTVNASASAPTTRFSYAIILDKQADVALGATPWNMVFQTITPDSVVNKEQSDRFVILKRGDFSFSNTGNQSGHAKIYIPLKGIHVTWNGTASSAFEKNHIFMLALSDQSTNVPTFIYELRYDYYDN